MSDNRSAVARALGAFGAAIRGDWSDIDGRSVRAQLDTLAAALAPEAPEATYEDLCRWVDVCPENRCWPEHCGERTGIGWCPHMERT